MKININSPDKFDKSKKKRFDILPTYFKDEVIENEIENSFSNLNIIDKSREGKNLDESKLYHYNYNNIYKKIYKNFPNNLFKFPKGNVDFNFHSPKIPFKHIQQLTPNKNGKFFEKIKLKSTKDNSLKMKMKNEKGDSNNSKSFNAENKKLLPLLIVRKEYVVNDYSNFRKMNCKFIQENKNKRNRSFRPANDYEIHETKSLNRMSPIPHFNNNLVVKIHFNKSKVENEIPNIKKRELEFNSSNIRNKINQDISQLFL